MTKAAYQSGMDRPEALAYGACPVEFDALLARYNGASIPTHELHGFKPPYSCAYHTGGTQGEQLRAIVLSTKQQKAVDTANNR